MGQCASKTQHAVEAASSSLACHKKSHKQNQKSQSPIATDPRASSSTSTAVTAPLAGPEPCSPPPPPRQTTPEVVPPVKAQAPASAPAPQAEAEEPGNMSAITALTAVSEETSERSSEPSDHGPNQFNNSNNKRIEQAPVPEQAPLPTQATLATPDTPTLTTTPCTENTDATPEPADNAPARTTTNSDNATLPVANSPMADDSAKSMVDDSAKSMVDDSAKSMVDESAKSIDLPSRYDYDDDGSEYEEELAAPVFNIKPNSTSTTSSRMSRRLSSDHTGTSRNSAPAIPRVQRRMSGGPAGMMMMMPRRPSGSGYATEGMIPPNAVVPREAAQAQASRFGNLRNNNNNNKNLKRDNSWFVLGYDSTSSSQHYRNMAYNTNNTNNLEDSWSGLTIPSQHYIPQNTQLRKLTSKQNNNTNQDSMTDSIAAESWAGLSLPSAYRTLSTDNESVLENSFATCTTRMTAGGVDDEDLLSIYDASLNGSVLQLVNNHNGATTITPAAPEETEGTVDRMVHPTTKTRATKGRIRRCQSMELPPPSTSILPVHQEEGEEAGTEQPSHRRRHSGGILLLD
ncbi:expressed unknown protein [Seminavis robusta]|uniref:Uncharacterized protein n=1 Tax=Seminavis robusta TaxID=568900 RepID=A0A9N8HYW8_9STRA|nr:expressed unknown protein [Seminavis robusta]|eukprot:Sro2676_g334410.1 n/a (571) ;mRNA; r:5135-6948